MHYLGLLLIPTLGLFWFISFLASRKDPQRKNKFIKLSLLSLFIFFLLMSPLLLFDLKHDFMNFNAFKQFFSNRQTTININPTNSDRFLPVIFQMVEDLLLSRQKILLPLVSFFVFILSILSYFPLNPRGKSGAKILFLWLIFAILGLGIYKQHVYAHYFGFIYPAIYLLAGLVISNLYLNRHLFIKIIAFVILTPLLFLSFKYSPLRGAPNRQLQRTETITDLIIKESDQKPFNFGLIAKQNYDESYRYFFENKQAKLVRGEEAITNQLFAVCEDGDTCQPLGNPAWQIAVFGQAEIEDQWQVDGIKIYRLVHQTQ